MNQQLTLLILFCSSFLYFDRKLCWVKSSVVMEIHISY